MSAGGVMQRVGGGGWSCSEVVQDSLALLPAGGAGLWGRKGSDPPPHAILGWFMRPHWCFRKCIEEGPHNFPLEQFFPRTNEGSTPVSQSCSWCIYPCMFCWLVLSSGCPRVVPEGVSRFCRSLGVESCVEFEHQDNGLDNLASLNILSIAYKCPH